MFFLLSFPKYSAIGAYEYLLKKATGRHIDVSRLFVYYNARAKLNGMNEYIMDTGCSVTSAIEALDEFGICLESVWPYDTSAVNERPSDEAYDAAENNKLADALQVQINLNEMKTCLAQGYPFVFGVRLFESFTEAARKGVIPKSAPTEAARGEHGRFVIIINKREKNFIICCRHAMLAVGYSDKKQAFIIRNSWGEDWVNKFLLSKNFLIYLCLGSKRILLYVI